MAGAWSCLLIAVTRWSRGIGVFVVQHHLTAARREWEGVVGWGEGGQTRGTCPPAATGSSSSGGGGGAIGVM